MKIIDIHWQTYRLPFAGSFTTAHGAMEVREGAIITITTDTGILGIGEMAPLAAFDGGTLAESGEALNTVIEYLRECSIDTALQFLQGLPLPHAVTYGLELALLDLLGKLTEYSVGMLLTETPLRTRIPVNAVVGAYAAEDAFMSALTAKARGFRCVKLKVGSMEDGEAEIERIAAVRSALGPDIHLRLDANEAWTFEEASTFLPLCVKYNIQYVEQPLKRADIMGMQQLRRTLSIPIAADEALQNIDSARSIMRFGAADILIIKPQLAGGLYASRQLISEATQRGIQCVVTTGIESGVSLAAALHLVAASPEITLECGLATQHLLVDDLINEQMPIQDGFMIVPDGIGLGITLDNAAMETYSSTFFQSHPIQVEGYDAHHDY